MSSPEESTPSAASRWLAPALCALVGLAWSVYLLGPAPLWPTSVEWMLQGDWAPPLLGWLYAREAPWSIPLGQAPGYLHPVGTSLAFTDATPWWALLFKLLSPVLPRAFQIHGPWLAVCFMLQGVFGALLAARLSPRPVHQVLGGTLFVLSPALAMRLGHLSLSGHWLLLALFWLYLRPSPTPRAASRTLALAALFVGLASGVHVYLAVMTLALALALVWRLWRGRGLLSGAHAGAWAAALTGGALGVMALFGYFTQATTSASGYGHYSSNLLSLVDSGGLSRVLPALRVGSGQYEGFGFLGLGVLLLGAGVLGVLGAKRRELGPVLPADVRPLVAMCLLLALFAFSSRVQLGGWTVLSYQTAFDSVLGPLGRAFRSAGRFIWPLHYLAMLGAVAGVLWLLRRRPAWWATVALGLAVGAQAVDLPAEEGCCRARFTPRVRPVPGGEDTWALAAGTYRHVVLYPPTRVDGAGRGCGGYFSSEELPPFAWQAWLGGMSFNSGYVARLDEPATLASCKRLEEDVQAGRLDASSIYVVHARAAEDFLRHTAGRATCGRWEDVLVCVATEARGPFREALERASAALPMARETP